MCDVVERRGLERAVCFTLWRPCAHLTCNAKRILVYECSTDNFHDQILVEVALGGEERAVATRLARDYLADDGTVRVLNDCNGPGP